MRLYMQIRNIIENKLICGFICKVICVFISFYTQVLGVNILEIRNAEFVKETQFFFEFIYKIVGIERWCA